MGFPMAPKAWVEQMAGQVGANTGAKPATQKAAEA